MSADIAREYTVRRSNLIEAVEAVSTEKDGRRREMLIGALVTSLLGNRPTAETKADIDPLQHQLVVEAIETLIERATAEVVASVDRKLVEHRRSVDAIFDRQYEGVAERRKQFCIDIGDLMGRLLAEQAEGFNKRISGLSKRLASLEARASAAALKGQEQDTEADDGR